MGAQRSTGMHYGPSLSRATGAHPRVPAVGRATYNHPSPNGIRLCTDFGLELNHSDNTVPAAHDVLCHWHRSDND